MPLTLERCYEIRKILEQADVEIDSIVNEFYLQPGAQNVAGNIGEISQMHAQLVEDLANRIRELEKETGKK